MSEKPQQLSLPLLILLISSVYLFTATSRAIQDDGDALYSHVAQQMVERGDWVTPYGNGVRFLDKPPVMYWLMALAYEILGMNEFAARLPSALAVLGIGWLLCLLGKKAGDRAAGFIAGLAAAFCVGTFLFTRMVFPDVIFVFLLTLSLTAFLQWYLDAGNPITPAMLFYASLAGAVLTKGLIGAFFPLAIVLLFLIWSRCWARLRHFHIGKGIVLFLALALPWHILAARRNPGFLWYFFVNEQFLRFLGRRQPVDYESIALPVFWILMLLWLFPWSAFFPAIRSLLRSALERRQTAWGAVVMVNFIWALVVLGFFSLSSRIEHYALPAFPPLAMLVGFALSPEIRGDPAIDQSRQRWIARGFSFLGALGGIVALTLAAAGLAWMGGRFRGANLREIADARAHAYTYYFAPLFDLPPQMFARLLIPLLGTCLALALGLSGAWWLNRRGGRTRAVLALCAPMVAFCLFAFQSLGVCEEILSSRQFARRLVALWQPGDSIVAIGDFETANSINFYCRVPLDVCQGTAAVLQWGLHYPDAPTRILDKANFEMRWSGPKRVFVLVPNGQIEGLGLKHGNVVMESAGRTLVCNQTIP